MPSRLISSSKGHRPALEGGRLGYSNLLQSKTAFKYHPVPRNATVVTNNPKSTAQNIARMHALTNPDYKYKPRKSAEIQRRRYKARPAPYTTSKMRPTKQKKPLPKPSTTTFLETNSADIYSLHEQWIFDQSEENFQTLLYSVDVDLLAAGF